MTRVLGLITARGGSKGVPGKNIRPLAGKPLIAWTIAAARAANRLDRLIVSTDDAKIAEVCRDYGAEVPFMRPVELARDDSPHIDCILHAVEWMRDHDGYQPDYLVLLQPTSPFRTAEDIDAAIDMAIRKQADTVVSVTETHDHPYLVRRIDEDGTLRPFVACDLAYPRRQDLPPAFALNGAVFVHRVVSLFAARNLNRERTLPYLMPPERSLQIDTPWDFQICEMIASQFVAANSGSAICTTMLQHGHS